MKGHGTNAAHIPRPDPKILGTTVSSAAMDEREFRRLLDLFPVVRSRNYCADPDLPKESTSETEEHELAEWQNAWAEVDRTESGTEDPFWQKLRLAAEVKVGPVEAERFCKAFQRVHKKLVSEESSLDAIRRFVDAAGSTKA